MEPVRASAPLCFAFAILVARGVIVESAGLTLLALGDWGGKSDGHPTTKAQISTARGMSSVTEDLNARGVLLLGDNFYEAGVQSCTSKRFQETFEEVYSEDLFKGLPFYVIAGNHDHDGNVSAQVDYKDELGRWHFPSLYYNLNFTFQASKARTAQLVMIDTVSLAGLSSDDCLGCELPGPKHLGSAESQWSWIEDQLKSSTADFLFVAGHYPIYSAGNDGTTTILVQRLLPLLKQYGAHYVSGHDHMVEHIVSDGVNMFVVGMGRECCYDDGNKHTVPDGAMQYMITGKGGKGKGGVGPQPASDVEGGFATLQFDDVVTITFYDQDGGKLYSAPPLTPRSAVLLV
mmetsp:Transcript_77776/g.137165  ORF Transcript_77776/g.137165 Transcript_77776/m.137165 type:complete len:346 (-) Transcript_77776:44-1081(-)